MKPFEKNIERMIQNLHTPAGEQLDKRMDALFSNAETQAARKVQPQNDWKIFLQSKLFRYAAAAVIIAAVFFGWHSPIGHEPGPGRLYAMSDLPDLLRQAKSVYIQGWIIVPAPGTPVDQQERKPFEYWFDADRGRMRLHQTAASQVGNQVMTVDQETVIDGPYWMRINHTDQTVTYQKMGDFFRRYLIRQNFDGLLNQLFLTFQGIGLLEKTGTETVDQTEYEIWEGTFTLPAPDKPAIQIRAQFDPVSGSIGRMKIWQDRGPEQTVITEITKIQRNPEIPDERFSLRPPEGYTAQNTPEDAKEISGEMSIGNYHFDSYSLHLHIAFLLKDGSVLLAWSGQNRDQPLDRQSVYAGLRPGGHLPNLPIVAEKLMPLFAEDPKPYPGYHLAVTCRDQQCIEWSLYVPTQESPENPLAFKLIHRIDDPQIQQQWKPEAMISTAFTIEDEQDFRDFVIGAMTELSDPGTAPESWTYEDVLSLTEQLRTGKTIELPEHLSSFKINNYPELSEIEKGILEIDHQPSWPEPKELVEKYWQARTAKDYEAMALYWPGSKVWNEQIISGEKPIEYTFGQPRQIEPGMIIVPYAAASYYKQNQTYNLKMLLSNKKSIKNRYYIISGN